MKAFLMYQDRDFEPGRALPWNAQDLVQDLELTTLFKAMSHGDEFLFEAIKATILTSLTDIDAIRYRQDILKDCLSNAALVREIYRIAVDAVESEKKHFRFGALSRHPSSVLNRSIEVLQMFAELLKQLRDTADRQAGYFQSEGFTRFFSMLREELDERYFATIHHHLRVLKFRGGVLISAQLGMGNKGAHYVLRKSPDDRRGWIDRIFSKGPPSYTFHIAPRDQSGARALSELENRGLAPVADALGQATEHILSFFKMLRVELAFYVGCLSLHEALGEKGEPVCFPVMNPVTERQHTAKGLYDVCLTLSRKGNVVGNELQAQGKDLVVITGANQGGKSTFLRGIGLSQMMMQCGMFVPAESFRANVCESVVTHYRREEDTAMDSGKFDDELKRMSTIVDHIGSDVVLLFNESFAATNEREGSEIARQIVGALLKKRVKIFFVTHFYEFANAFYSQGMANAHFLRADRQTDGRRTFKLVEGEPLQTGYGQDLYDRIFSARG